MYVKWNTFALLPQLLWKFFNFLDPSLVMTVSILVLFQILLVNNFWMFLDVIKDVQDEMLKSENSGQIFAVVHIGE